MNTSEISQGGASITRYGVAIDVGTSSIWSRLVDLGSPQPDPGSPQPDPGSPRSDAPRDPENASVLDTLVIPNPQQRHGADIASRLGLADEDPSTRAELHGEVIGAIDDSISRLCADAGIGPDEIGEVVAVGNSAMYAFMLDLDPGPLCGTPYNLKGAQDFQGPAASLGINLPAANLFIPRPIFGYVGADALADVLLIGMTESGETELIVDVGTNCEMALGNREKILVASSPAGPAYEDSHMSFGLSATEGAIYKAEIRGDAFEYSVVGGGEPRGICGSGLIDIIAEMRRNGWVDESGRLLREGPVTVAEGREKITVSQHDIRSFQLVKASVHAAISVIRMKFGSEDLGRMLITGTFGSYINLDNARLLKMFPDLPNDRVEVVADAACQGAVLMLGGKSKGLLEELRGRIRHVALPLNKNFQDEFIRLMSI
ncbi:MAG: ASKHA domain-containing protein [Actinobacteria bacterium]|nr:ASKHA domain-containing protein [Actinomycetota bacterium]MCL5882865.1 ASKHA domain-containing protein [Actinomycetota bacterium]